jgi:hypothetical protein
VGTSNARVDPQLGPLADNGGAARTHALAETSPAVDAVLADVPPGVISSGCVPGGGGRDQRDVRRPKGAACDTGAFELIPPRQNLLVNGSFELDANTDTRPDSWSPSDARFTRSNTRVLAGLWAGRHRATNNTGYVISQLVPVTAGLNYNFLGWVNIPPTSDVFDLSLEVRWRNANAVISTGTLILPSSPTPGWRVTEGRFLAPAGATQARVRMVVSSLNGTIFVDGFVFGP